MRGGTRVETQLGRWGDREQGGDGGTRGMRLASSWRDRGRQGGERGHKDGNAAGDGSSHMPRRQNGEGVVLLRARG